MANIITAGNSTNGGTAITTDTSGTLNIVTGSGSGSNAITIDASQAVTMPGTLAVTSNQTVGGNLTVTGTLTASGGVSGSITSGTAVTASGTSVNFTGIPSGVKRITVMFSGVSLNASSNILVQIGTSGGVVTTGYASTASRGAATISTANATTGFFLNGGNGTEIISGLMTITNLSGNTWISSHSVKLATTITSFGGGDVTLGAVLDRVRITSLNGTDTFDAGTINIFYE